MGKQGIAFRGKHEDLSNVEETKNPGIFLAILREIGHYFPALADHMFQPTRKNETYLRVQSQNEIIEIIAKHIIQRGRLKVAG